VRRPKQGLKSPVLLKGSAPGLGGYRIRIEDRASPPSLALALLEVLTAALPADEGNEALYPGPHVSDFGDQLERTQYMALGVPPGMVWQAKSASLARSTLALSSISSRR